MNARAAGPRLGKQVQQVIVGSKKGDWAVNDGSVVCAGIDLEEGEYTLETVVDENAAAGRASAMLSGGGFVVLDTELTPELESEGIARDIVRAVQQARKDAGLEVTDRISLTVTGDLPMWDAVLMHRDLITTETLASQFGCAPNLDALPQEGSVNATVGDGLPIRVVVKRL